MLGGNDHGTACSVFAFSAAVFAILFRRSVRWRVLCKAGNKMYPSVDTSCFKEVRVTPEPRTCSPLVSTP